MMLRHVGALCLSVAALAACSRGVGPDAAPTASKGVPPALTVATVDFASTWLVEQVGGKAVESDRITAAQLATTSADLFAYIPGLDPVVDAAVTTLPEEQVIDLTQDVKVLDDPLDPARPDPNVWFDPAAVAQMAATLGEYLIDASPTAYEAQRYYGLRSLALQDRAQSLDTDAQERFDACRIGTLVVDRPILTYLAHAYAFDQIPLGLWKPRKAPVEALYYTPDAAARARRAAAQQDVRPVVIDQMTRDAPDEDLLQGVTDVMDRIAANQDCPRIKPVSTDRPG